MKLILYHFVVCTSLLLRASCLWYTTCGELSFARLFSFSAAKLWPHCEVVFPLFLFTMGTMALLPFDIPHKMLTHHSTAAGQPGSQVREGNVCTDPRIRLSRGTWLWKVHVERLQSQLSDPEWKRREVWTCKGACLCLSGKVWLAPGNTQSAKPGLHLIELLSNSCVGNHV